MYVPVQHIVLSLSNNTSNEIKLLLFLPRDASAERGDATVSRPSVRPSVRLSVCL